MLQVNKNSFSAKIVSHLWLLSLPKYGNVDYFSTIQYNHSSRVIYRKFLSARAFPKVYILKIKIIFLRCPLFIFKSGTTIPEYGTKRPFHVLKQLVHGTTHPYLYTDSTEHGTNCLEKVLKSSEHSLTFPEQVLNCLFLVMSCPFQVPKRLFLGMDSSFHIRLPDIIGWQASLFVIHLVLTLNTLHYV